MFCYDSNAKAWTARAKYSQTTSFYLSVKRVNINLHEPLHVGETLHGIFTLKCKSSKEPATWQIISSKRDCAHRLQIKRQSWWFQTIHESSDRDREVGGKEKKNTCAEWMMMDSKHWKSESRERKRNFGEKAQQWVRQRRLGRFWPRNVMSVICCCRKDGIRRKQVRRVPLIVVFIDDFFFFVNLWALFSFL